MRRRQQGATFIGTLFMFVFIGLVVYGGIRLVPVYLNYMKVATTLEKTAHEMRGETTDEGNLRRSLERHWIVEDISAVDFKDVEIKRDNGVITLHVAYQDVVPYIADVSLSVSFDKTVKVE
jgi:hypothetical protein